MEFIPFTFDAEIQTTNKIVIVNGTLKQPIFLFSEIESQLCYSQLVFQLKNEKHLLKEMPEISKMSPIEITPSGGRNYDFCKGYSFTRFKIILSL